MKIVPKFTIALVGGMCVMLATNGYLRVRRESEALRRERLQRHRLTAASLGTAVRAAWKTDGEEAALEKMEATVARYSSMSVRWRPTDTDVLPHFDMGTALGGLRDPLTRSDETVDPPTWFTYVPIIVDGRARGEIELSEPTTPDAERARSIVYETVKTASALTVLSAVLSFFLGQWVVGHPVRALTDKARRIGRGEFGDPLEIESPDELAELAREMNAMCERLVTTLEHLRHADRLATVGKLASGVAHELGTPLNVVSARAEMIAEGRTTSEDAREYARVIGRASERMTRIISQLLQFARRKSVERAPAEVGALVTDAVELLRPFANKRNLAIELATVPVEALVDAGQLQQVVTNLVMNAIQASPDGGRIAVRVEESFEAPPPDIGGPPRDAVCITVSDEGSGILPEDLSRIFEPFFTTKEIGEGTGLGLAVSYGIVREHRGWMTVTSEPGAGATFTVVLPHGGGE